MIKKLALLTTVLSISLASVALSAEEGGSGTYDIKKQTIEVAAPDFMLKDLEGKMHSLSDYSGKTVLLTFTTTWCPYCKKEIPDLKKIYQEYKGRDFELIAVYIQESDKKMASFAKNNELPYKILLDYDGNVARLYGIRGVPTKVLINREGTILCWACRTIEVMLEQELGGKGMEP